MQNHRISRALLGLVVLAAAAPAYAEDVAVAGTYNVKFEQVSTNCSSSLNYPQSGGALKIDVKASELQVDIDRTPLMVGKVNKTGKVSAKSPKPGHTPIEGMDGVFSVAGRVDPAGLIALVMVGEYQHDGKPLCTQSWNVSGLRQGAAPSDKPGKK